MPEIFILLITKEEEGTKKEATELNLGSYLLLIRFKGSQIDIEFSTIVVRKN